MAQLAREIESSESRNFLTDVRARRMRHLALRTLQLSNRRPLATMSAGITEREKFEFDLNGFLVLRNALSAEEVAPRTQRSTRTPPSCSRARRSRCATPRLARRTTPTGRAATWAE